MSYEVRWLDKDGDAYSTAPLEADTLAGALSESTGILSRMMGDGNERAFDAGLFGYGFHVREVRDA